MVAGNTVAEVAGCREQILKMVNSRTDQYFKQCAMKRTHQGTSA